MANEGLIIDVDYNVTKAEAKQRKLNREFEISKQKAANISKEIKQTEKNISDSIAKQKELDKELDRSANKLESYEKGNVDFTKKQFQLELKRNQQIQSRIAKEELYQKSQETSLARQNIALKKQNSETVSIGEKIASSTQKQSKLTQAFEQTTKSAQKFGKRIGKLAVFALVFSVISKAFRSLRDSFGKLISQEGSKTAGLLSKIKGNLAVMGQTLFQSVKPFIEWILQKLVHITNLLANVLAKVLKKDVNEMKNLAKETTKAGEAAKKATAGFDTLQTIDTSTSDGENASNITFDIMPTGDGIANKITGIFDKISKAIKNAAKANSPIVKKAWELFGKDSKEWLKKEIKEVTEISGDGISDIIEIFASEEWVNLANYIVTILGFIWNFVKGGLNEAKTILKATFKFIGGIISGFITTLSGVFDILSGLFKVFIGLIEWVVGAFTGNTEKMQSGTQKMGDGIKKILQGIIKVFVGLVNSLSTVVNFIWEHIVGALRGVVNSVGGLISKIGKTIGYSNWGWKWEFKTPTIPELKVPQLATGAILPGGSPMLAWVNDQPKGQPYVEGSIENIAAAFEKYLGGRNFGNQNITLEANGNWAQFIKWMNLQIKQENNRATIWG